MPKSYRFWGAIRPEPGIRASVLSPAVADDGAVTLRLYDPIDSWGGEWGVSAKEFADTLAQIPKGTERIDLHLNSPGGEVWEALAIMNQLREHSSRVVAHVDGLAASAASFIAASADELVMGRNSQLMIHDAMGGCIGFSADMRDMASRLDQVSDNIASIYQAKAGSSLEFWRQQMVAETWFTAGEAVSAGLADSVSGEQESQPSNRFDLSVFAHAGREDAPAPVLPPADTPDPTETAKVAARFRARGLAARARTL